MDDLSGIESNPRPDLDRLNEKIDLLVYLLNTAGVLGVTAKEIDIILKKAKAIRDERIIQEQKAERAKRKATPFEKEMERQYWEGFHWRAYGR